MVLRRDHPLSKYIDKVSCIKCYHPYGLKIIFQCCINWGPFIIYLCNFTYYLDPVPLGAVSHLVLQETSCDVMYFAGCILHWIFLRLGACCSRVNKIFFVIMPIIHFPSFSQRWSTLRLREADIKLTKHSGSFIFFVCFYI